MDLGPVLPDRRYFEVLRREAELRNAREDTAAMESVRSRIAKRVEAGLRVAHVGRSSVRYEVGLFAAGEPLSAAAGHFVHVYVDRQTRRPTELPAALRTALDALKVSE